MQYLTKVYTHQLKCVNYGPFKSVFFLIVFYAEFINYQERCVKICLYGDRWFSSLLTVELYFVTYFVICICYAYICVYTHNQMNTCLTLFYLPSVFYLYEMTHFIFINAFLPSILFWLILRQLHQLSFFSACLDIQLVKIPTF